MKIKIRIIRGDRLSQRFNLPTEGLNEKYEAVKEEWQKLEPQILTGLQEITGLLFLQNFINVYLVDPTQTFSISTPIIVSTKENTKHTIRIIIHELIHNLIWDNTKKVDWYKKAEELWKNEKSSVIVHIVVHSILEAIYKDILKKPIEIENDIKECQNWPSYKRAWEIVKKEGYKNIIKKLKSK